MTDFTKFVKSAQAPNTIRQVATDLGVNPQVRPPARPEGEFPLTDRTHAPAQQSRAEQSMRRYLFVCRRMLCLPYPVAPPLPHRTAPHRSAAAIDCNGKRLRDRICAAEMTIHVRTV